MARKQETAAPGERPQWRSRGESEGKTLDRLFESFKKVPAATMTNQKFVSIPESRN